MYKSASIITLSLLGLVLLAGCDGLLDTTPTTNASPEDVVENIDGIEAILTSTYHRLRSESRYGREITLTPDILADNAAKHPVTSGRGDGYAANTHQSHITFWNTAYMTINEANFVIEGSEQVEDVPQSTRDRLRGEGLFQRGFAYFDLARTYGYEPGREIDGWAQSAIIRTSSTRDVDDADFRPRSSNVEVYEQAVSDLEEAIELLAEDDRGVFYANYVGANALLSRIHLYLENWQEAIDYADVAMAGTNIELLDTESAFISNPYSQVPNPESLFEININPTDEGLGSNVGLCPWTNPTHWFDIVLSQDLVDQFDENDYRNHLIGEHTDSHGTWPYNLKWSCSEGPFDDNIPVIRLPELYLIKAEAYAELGQLDQAMSYLGTLQEARGLTAFSSGSQSEIIEEILVERRRELHFEGHRFYDLKRRGMNITKQAGATTVPYSDYRVLSYLTQGEVDGNPHLDQNPGY